MQNLNIGFAPGNEARGFGQEIRALKNGQIQDGSGRGTKHWRFQDCCSMKDSIKHNESLTSGFFLKPALKTFQNTLLHFSILEITTGQMQRNSVLERCIL